MKTKRFYKFIFAFLGIICLLAFLGSVEGVFDSSKTNTALGIIKKASDFIFASSSSIGFAFALTGYVKTCGKKSSGVRFLFLNESANVTGHTLNSQNPRDYSAITHNANPFKKYEFDQDQCEFTEVTTMENGSFMNTITITFRLGKMSPEVSTAIMEMVDASYCGMEGLVVDNSGNNWYVGYNEEQLAERPLKFASSDGTTGLALSDESGDTVTLTCITTEKSYTYSGPIADLTT